MSTSAAENTLALQVHDVGFLLDRLGQDCHPLQFLRELTQNSIEAILKTQDKSGQIIWDVDWLSLDLEDHSVFKLCITDTGCGMTGEEMRQYINQLSSSGSVQSSEGNYGVGAKVAAATRNHEGLIYLSWKDGQGAMIHLWRNPDTGQYGLRQIEHPDGSFGHWAELDELVAACREKERESRPASITAIKEVLDRIALQHPWSQADAKKAWDARRSPSGARAD